MTERIKIPTYNLYLDRRRKLTKKEDTYPIKLVIYYKGKREFYRTGYECTIEQYDAIVNNPRKREYKDLADEFKAIETRAKEIIQKMPEFSFDEFKKEYFYVKEVKEPEDVFKAFDSYILTLLDNGQYNSVQTYQTAKKSLQTYYKGDILPFNLITPIWLTAYEKWMLKKGKSITTIAINCRNLRVLFNRARVNDPSINYPFGRESLGLYKIPESRNIKKALSKADLKKLYNYKPIDNTEQYYKDLWFFSYLCNGINFADISSLKYKNLTDDDIIFIRKKSKRRILKPIVAVRTPDINRIIKTWGNDPEPENYVFNIIKPEMTPVQELDAIKQTVKLTNKYVKRIAEKLKISSPITTYTCRHTFASILKLSGESIEYISESLGHSDLSVTESYLSNFDTEKRKKASRLLTNF